MITEKYFFSQRHNPIMTKSDNLKNKGLKATLPRIKILELFQKTETRHLSADDVYQMLLAEGLDIGLATVYRVLTQFEQAGLLERRHFDSDKSVFELKASVHHDHLICVKCGGVEEFYDEDIERRQNKIAKERGFTIRAHALYLYGECGNCAAPKKK